MKKINRQHNIQKAPSFYCIIEILKHKCFTRHIKPKSDVQNGKKLRQTPTQATHMCVKTGQVRKNALVNEAVLKERKGW